MRNLGLVWCLVLVAGCAEDAVAPTAVDAGADGSGGGAGSGGASGDGSGSGEAAIPPCGGGYDLNGDGVCETLAKRQDSIHLNSLRLVAFGCRRVLGSQG
jgi:hypothetical protein